MPPDTISSGSLNDCDRAVETIATIRTAGTVRAWRAVRPGIAAIAAATEAATDSRRTCEPTTAACRIAMDGAASDGFSDYRDVTAVTARSTIPSTTALSAIATLATIATGVAGIGREATTTTDAAIPAPAASTAITALAAACVDVHANDEVIHFDGDVAAKLASGAIGSSRAGLTIAADIAVEWIIIPIPVIDAVSTLLAGLTTRTVTAGVAIGTVIPARNDIGHSRTPFVRDRISSSRLGWRHRTAQPRSTRA